MECNGIAYEIIDYNWNVRVWARDFANYLNELIKSLTKNEVINLTIFSLEEDIKEQAGTVYKDLKEFKVTYDNEIGETHHPYIFDDILITFKDGTVSLNSILKDVVPKNFFFFNLDSLKDFSMWGSRSNDYEAVYLMLFMSYSIRRIRFTKEVLSDE